MFYDGLPLEFFPILIHRYNSFNRQIKGLYCLIFPFYLNFTISLLLRNFDLFIYLQLFSRRELSLLSLDAYITFLSAMYTITKIMEKHCNRTAWWDICTQFIFIFFLIAIILYVKFRSIRCNRSCDLSIPKILEIAELRSHLLIDRHQN